MIEDLRKVTFTFKCYEKESADLKIRLRYDKLQQTEFFVSVLRMYINNDPSVLDVVEKIKKEKGKMGKNKIRHAQRDLSRGREILKDLGITESDKNSIFDMIESSGVDDE